MAQENDLVLIYFEKKPLSFARIEDISPDVKRGWYLVRLMMLQMPIQMVTWILRDVYIDGEEFTMNGKKMRIEKVIPPKIPLETGEDEKNGPAKKTGGIAKTTGAEVISFRDMKKK